MHSDFTEVIPGKGKEKVGVNFALSIKLSQFSILVSWKFHEIFPDSIVCMNVVMTNFTFP